MYPLNVVLVGCPDDLADQLIAEMTELNARVRARFPDIPSAVTRVASAAAWTEGHVCASRAQVFIVYLREREEARSLGWLKRTFDGSPIIALADEPHLHLAVSQGADEAIALPPQPGVLKATLEDVGRPFNAPDGPPKVLAVAGVAGGVGATTLAVNIARELAGRGQCVLIELTHRMGTVADFLNLNPEVTTRDVALEGDRIDLYRIERGLLPVGDNLRVLAGPPASPSCRPAPARELLRIVEMARGLSGTIVIDVPCTHDDLYYNALGLADRILLVGLQRVPTVRAWQVVIKTALVQSPSRKPALVANRFETGVPGMGVQEMARLLGRITPHTVCADPESVNGAINRCKMVRDYAPTAAVTTDIAALAEAVVTGDGQPPVELCAVSPANSGVLKGTGVIRMFQAFRRG